MAAGKAITWPVNYSGSTPTVYCHILDGAGSIYRFGATNAFEIYSTANIAEYKLAATELGTDSRMFQVALPTDATDIPAGGYYIVGRTQSGGSPAEADPVNYEGWFHFDGTNWSYVGGPVASVTGAVGSVTGNVGGNVVGSVGSVAAGGITASSVATNAIDADALAADAVIEIQAGLSTLDAAGVRTAVGLASANLDTQFSGIAAAVWAAGTRTLSSFGTLVADVATAVWAAATRTLTAFGFTPTVDVVSISGDTAAADNLEAAADGTGYNLGGGSVVAASVTGAVGSVTGAVGSVTGAVGSVGSGGITAASIATGAIDADALAADAGTEIATALLDLAAGVETGLTLRQALRLVVAASAAKLSGAATTTITIRNYGDDRNRITATVDADGNRSAITYDLT